MLSPPNCRVTRRIRKKEKQGVAAAQIGRFILNKRKPAPVAEAATATPAAATPAASLVPKMSYVRRTSAAKRIGRFIKRTENIRRARFLKAICTDSGVCVAFGKEKQKIVDYFNKFVDFTYVKPPIKQIGAVSANGFVKEIQYERQGYKAYAVLKSSAGTNTDNLVYEYMVGRFINEMAKKFPCFVETYGLFYYRGEPELNHMKNTRMISANVLKDALEYVPPENANNLARACSQSKHACVLIQHLKGVDTIDAILDRGVDHTTDFMIHEAANVFYQIYYPLAHLRSKFTHYDLHTNNVLLYEPVKGKYITYHYQLPDGDFVVFNSKYIAKIIDYGRSYFYKDNVENPLTIYSNLCKEPQCDPYCGYQKGFGWLTPITERDKKNMFINSYHSNESHDLRLLNNISYVLQRKKYKILDTIRKFGFNNMSKQLYEITVTLLEEMMQKVNYGVGLKVRERVYGTKENNDSGLPTHINNVKDAEESLRDILLNGNVKMLNQYIYDDPRDKLGDIHVYSDGRAMTFTST
jgi:hypothetical protein